MVAYSLVMVGAHNGSKTVDLVERHAAAGRVLLIEPVPYLFEDLRKLHHDNESVEFLNAAVVDSDVSTIRFFAPRRESNDIVFYGDQLGSLSPNHAVDHEPGLAGLVEEIEVPAITFQRLLKQFDISAIQLLYTDTEGFDARLLASFPFSKLRPNEILFEYKHSDGLFRIGRHFALALVLLEAHGYNTSVVDVENCIARRVDS